MTDSFIKNVTRTWGDKGVAWLQELPSIVDTLAEYWNLTGLVQFPDLSFNYVMRGCHNEIPIVLKIVYDYTEFHNEQRALTAYDGNGCIRLLEHNSAYHGLLLEQAIPGSSLVSFFPDRDEQAIEHTVSIMQQLHKASLPADISSLEDWFRDLFDPPIGLNSYHVDKAQEITGHLFATQPKPVLLHGDLHHGNILLSERGWVAIDPKGISGDPAFEVCAFIKNPDLAVLKRKDMVIHRLSLFSQFLSIDIERLYAWLYAQAVLDACWSMKEGETDQAKALEQAELIDAIDLT